MKFWSLFSFIAALAFGESSYVRHDFKNLDFASHAFANQEFEEIFTLFQTIQNFCSPESCFLVGVGKSPAPIVALFQIYHQTTATTLPISDMRNWEDGLISNLDAADTWSSATREKVFIYFDAFFKNIPTTQRILFIDYFNTGAGINRFKRYMNEYIEFRNLPVQVDYLAFGTGVRSRDLNRFNIPLLKISPELDNSFHNKKYAKWGPYLGHIRLNDILAFDPFNDQVLRTIPEYLKMKNELKARVKAQSSSLQNSSVSELKEILPYLGSAKSNFQSVIDWALTEVWEDGTLFDSLYEGLCDKKSGPEVEDALISLLSQEIGQAKFLSKYRSSDDWCFDIDWFKFYERIKSLPETSKSSTLKNYYVATMMDRTYYNSFEISSEFAAEVIDNFVHLGSEFLYLVLSKVKLEDSEKVLLHTLAKEQEIGRYDFLKSNLENPCNFISKCSANAHFEIIRMSAENKNLKHPAKKAVFKLYQLTSSQAGDQAVERAKQVLQLLKNIPEMAAFIEKLESGSESRFRVPVQVQSF